MFGNEFYPTPREVIEQMLNGYSPENKIILEPSAGKGNIVDYLKETGAKDVIACELEPNLRKILATKCNVITDDFLKLTSDKISHIHAIIANPPFSNAAEHIMHAWDIAPAGCTIISLCNSDTLKNTYSNLRKQLSILIGEHGHSVDLGQCFQESERLTGVYVSAIYLQKPGQSKETEFEGFFLEDDEPELHANAIMPYNFIRDLVQRYIGTLRIFDQQLELAVQMNELTSSFFSGKIGFSCSSEGKPKLRNDYKKELQKSAWHYVFSKMNMQKHATKGLREDINAFVEQQTQIPFTMKNIYRMIDIVIGTTGQRMDKALLEVFDKITERYDENRFGFEGWKTNSHYILNEKFIMPWVTKVGWSGEIDTYWNGNVDVVEDFQKALCYITGTRYEECTTFYEFIHRKNKQFGQLYSWGFFEFRAYKKGTIHFKFQSKDLWATFNQNIARIKGFPLPESMKK
jgi:hypothetical protein